MVRKGERELRASRDLEGDMKAPCRNCEERAPKCHSVCPKYKAFRESVERLREAQKNKGYEADCFRADAVVRLKKRHKGEHGR